MINIMTIDLEDWYNDADFVNWDQFEDRIYANTCELLDMFHHANAKATFFVLGYIAERFPEIIRYIDSKGHEIAVHGYIHKPLFDQTPDEFEKSIVYSIEIIKGIIQKEIMGFRAPMFSLTNRTRWAIPIIARYFQYDSSIVPARTPLYGIPNSPRDPYYLLKDNKTLCEIPVATYQIPLVKANIPIAGGFYLRLFPYKFNKNCISSMNIKGIPAVVYLHPWELDTSQPKIKSNKWWHYHKLESTKMNLGRLLADFKFQSARDYIASRSAISYL